LITRWLKGKKLDYGKGAQRFYNQVRALLKGLGISEKEIDEKIEAAVFEERGWEGEVKTRQEELLLTARKRVAQRFGGVLPQDTGIPGVSRQGERCALTSWIKEEKMDLDENLLPQVRALLIHEDFMSPEAADQLITDAKK
jgi:hypothetical protein